MRTRFDSDRCDDCSPYGSDGPLSYVVARLRGPSPKPSLCCGWRAWTLGRRNSFLARRAPSPGGLAGISSCVSTRGNAVEIRVLARRKFPAHWRKLLLCNQTAAMASELKQVLEVRGLEPSTPRSRWKPGKIGCSRPAFRQLRNLHAFLLLMKGYHCAATYRGGAASTLKSTPGLLARGNGRFSCSSGVRRGGLKRAMNTGACADSWFRIRAHERTVWSCPSSDGLLRTARHGRSHACAPCGACRL